MSEHQYYEFRAIDRPLTDAEISALERISTRARITPVSFTNVYNWGDFKGDPIALMMRYYDAHVYWANWGTADFMLRVPIEVIPQSIVESLEVDGMPKIRSTDEHRVIVWRQDQSERGERFIVEGDDEWMVRLMPVRDELLRGDYRSLYLGWLLGVGWEAVDEDTLEPLSPCGLRSLTAAQKSLAEFLDLDSDLLEGAAMGSPDRQENEPSDAERDEWLSTLTREEVFDLLRQLLDGDGVRVERNLRNRYLEWQRSLRGDIEAPGRSAGEVLANAEEVRRIRTEREKLELRLREAELRKQREAELAALAADFPSRWASIDRELEGASAAAYDSCCRRVADLAEAYERYSGLDAFEQALRSLLARHRKRRTFIRRLIDAGIWKHGYRIPPPVLPYAPEEEG